MPILLASLFILGSQTKTLHEFIISPMCTRYYAHSILVLPIISIAFWISTKYDDPEDHGHLGRETISLADCYSHFTGMYTLKNECINLPNYMAPHPRDSILQSLSQAPQIVNVRVIYYDWQSVGQSVLVLGIHLGPVTNFSHSPFDYFLDSFGYVDVGRPLWREVGSVLFSFCQASPVQPFSDLSPMGLMSIVYCLYFWDSPNLEGQVPVFISPRNRVTQLYPRAWGSPQISHMKVFITESSQTSITVWSHFMLILIMWTWNSKT
jgi:hypothetical protein